MTAPARAEVLRRVRLALGRDGEQAGEPVATPAAPRAASDRPRGYRRSGELSPPALLDLLAERLADYGAGVVRVRRRASTGVGGGDVAADPAPERVGEAVASLIGDERPVLLPPGLDVEICAAGLEATVDDGVMAARALDGFPVVVTACSLAIAETGTIVLDGGAGQGRRALTLVPDHHVCVVHSEQVVASVPEAVRRLDPARPQTWISGPSATSDIELVRVQGVHGPRRLDVVIVEQ